MYSKNFSRIYIVYATTIGPNEDYVDNHAYILEIIEKIKDTHKYVIEAFHHSAEVFYAIKKELLNGEINSKKLL